MINKLKVYAGVLLAKLGSLANPRICFSANLMHSRPDKTAAVRQKCRIYRSSVGRYSVIGRNTLMQNCEVGNFCAVSEGCNIGLPSHPLQMVSSSSVFLEGGNYLKKSFAQFAWEACPRTVIGSDVWIGAHVQIKSGLNIGHGAVVAAGAVVTHDVEPYSIVAGVPAKEIRKRFDDETVAALLDTRWWEMDDSEIAKYAHCFNDPSAFISALKGDRR